MQLRTSLKADRSTVRRTGESRGFRSLPRRQPWQVDTVAGPTRPAGAPSPLSMGGTALGHDSREGPVRKAGESEAGSKGGGYFLMYKRDVWALRFFNILGYKKKILCLKKRVLWLKKFEKGIVLKTVNISAMESSFKCRGHLLHSNF